MNVSVRFEYNNDDVCEIVLKHHERTEAPPRGYKWKVTWRYGEVVVEAVAIDETPKAVEEPAVETPCDVPFEEPVSPKPQEAA